MVKEKWDGAWQNNQNDLCTQHRLRSAWTPTQFNQSSVDQPGHSPSRIRVSGDPLMKVWVLATHKTHWRLIRLVGCTAGSNSSLGAQVIVLVLLWSGSNYFHWFEFDRWYDSIMLLKIGCLFKFVTFYTCAINTWRFLSCSSLVFQQRYEPCHEKTCLRGFQPGKIQTDLLNYID